MPRDYASFSKEFPIAAIDEALRLAGPHLSKKQFRDLVQRSKGQSGFASMVVQRFLVIRGDRIVRDRFLALLEVEDIESPRIRKIMFGVWALRDDRLARYIKEVIADERGRWRVPELLNKTQSKFFAQFGAEATAIKSRSNIEHFLIEAGILIRSPLQVSLDPSDRWLEDSVAIVAQDEPDEAVRREMVYSPIQYLIRNRLNSIANATIEDLQARPYNASIEDDSLPTPIPDNAISTDSGRKWNRPRPSFDIVTNPLGILRDPVAMERAGLAHHRLEELLCSAAREAGHDPLFETCIDIFFTTESGWVLAEIKSCHDLNFQSQLRRGVSQLLEYSYRARRSMPTCTRLLVMETAPPMDYRWVTDYLQTLAIIPAWPDKTRRYLLSTAAIPAALHNVVRHVTS